MKRIGLAAVLVAAFGTSASARQPIPPLPAQPPQPVPAAPGTRPILPPGAYSPIGIPNPNIPANVLPTGILPGPLLPMPEPWNPTPGLVPNPVPPPPTYSGPAGPAIPYQKMGGLVVGETGYYPYDTGAWLLGGTDGLTRQSGAFTMVFPGGNGADSPYLPAAGPTCRKPGLFKRLSTTCH